MASTRARLATYVEPTRQTAQLPTRLLDRGASDQVVSPSLSPTLQEDALHVVVRGLLNKHEALVDDVT